MCLDRFVCAFLLEKMKGDESFSLPWILSYLRSFYNGDRKNGSQNWRSVTYIDQKNPSPPEEHFYGLQISSPSELNNNKVEVILPRYIRLISSQATPLLVLGDFLPWLPLWFLFVLVHIKWEIQALIVWMPRINKTLVIKR